MGRLSGKVALISGGARGQGESEARLFVREGAKVVFGDILDEQGQMVESDINKDGGVLNISTSTLQKNRIGCQLLRLLKKLTVNWISL